MSAIIGCRALRVHAGRTQLLDVGDLDVAGGTCLAILGPNGAGKSTLLRTLGLLTSHRVSGQVLLDGAPATPVRMRADAAAVLQRAILRRGTVASNVSSGLRFRGVPGREAEQRSQPWLDVLGIAALADRDVGTLSGGEAQRVCIARALATDPRVLLLDEPFGGLDAPTRADLIADLRAALAGRPIAVVLVTHDVEEARALAGVTALLVRGELRQLGPTAEILDAPADLDTARLLGFVNALPAELTNQDTRWVAKPEHCRVRAPAQPPRPATASVVGTVRRHIALGPVTRIDVAVGRGVVTCLHPVQEDVEVEIGQSVVVDVTAARPLPSATDAVAPARSG